MSKFHSVVSRREFMKGLGIAGAGVGAASLVSPIFHDLDEVVASDSAQMKRPWWVKSRPLENPSVEMDWSIMYRSDGQWTGQQAPCQTHYLGVSEVARRSALSTAFTNSALQNNTPGSALRDQALSGATFQNPTFSFMGPQTAKTPALYGVPAWTGSPEEASRMMRSAMTYFGAGGVGFAEVTQNVKTKMVRQWDKGPLHQQYIFEDVPVGYDDAKSGGKLVLPANVQLYDYAFLIPMSKELWRSAPGSAINYADDLFRYSRVSMLQTQLQQFTRGLGYQTYGYTQPYNGIVPAAGATMLAGLTEQGRNSGVNISPELGSIVGQYSFLGALPVAPTPPVDAGIFRFCHTCHKCANACPFSVISQDNEPSWEIPDIYGKPDTTHIPGKKQFWSNGIECWTMIGSIGHCGTCMATCTFNTGTNAIHQYVKATLATTPIFNSFLWNADTTFGFGLHADKEAWWDMSQPTYGFNSTEFVKNADY